MHVYINHCWCSDSNWGGVYDCRHIVSLKRVPKNKNYHDDPDPDWDKIIDKKEYQCFDQSTYQEMKELMPEKSDEEHRRWANKRTIRLKPEVLQWLNENIKDCNNKKQPKAWAIGSDVYNSATMVSFSLFFYRLSDAMKFVKAWSIYQKPTTFLNYFDDIRKELNIETNKLEIVDEFTKF